MHQTSYTLCIVVPAYNEQEVITEFYKRLSAVLDKIDQQSEMLFIDDGSQDQTVELILSLKQRDPRISLIQLSRNFGKEIALAAGLDHADADATIIIDSDLQDPPELIPKLIERWHEGHDVVYAKRTHRKGETALKKLTAFLFYRILNRLSCIYIPQDTGDFRLISRPALEALKKLKERNRYMKGLYSWIGFSQTALPYDRDARFAGKPKFNYFKLWSLALEGITSFTTKPLKFSSYIGFVTATGSFFYGLGIIFQKLILGNDVAGYPSLMTVILFMGGIQLMTLGILGEYLARTFNETKGRPLYIVKQNSKDPMDSEVGLQEYHEPVKLKRLIAR